MMVLARSMLNLVYKKVQNIHTPDISGREHEETK